MEARLIRNQVEAEADRRHHSRQAAVVAAAEVVAEEDPQEGLHTATQTLEINPTGAVTNTLIPFNLEC